MTIKDLNRARRITKEDNQQAVFDALVELGELSTTKEIREHLESKNHELNKKFELKAQEMFENDELHSRKDMRKYISEHKSKTMSIRTIERHIREDKRIKKKYDRYYITDKARDEIKYLNARILGNELLNNLSIQSYTKLTVEQYVSELVQRFGALVVYSFIEGARPFEDNSLNAYEKDRLVESWIQNAIPIQVMYTYFHAIFSNRNIEEYDPETESMDELDNETIMTLVQALKKKYPHIYENMYRARLAIMGKRVGRNFDADISSEK